MFFKAIALTNVLALINSNKGLVMSDNVLKFNVEYVY